MCDMYSYLSSGCILFLFSLLLHYFNDIQGLLWRFDHVLDFVYFNSQCILELVTFCYHFLEIVNPACMSGFEDRNHTSILCKSSLMTHGLCFTFLQYSL